VHFASEVRRIDGFSVHRLVKLLVHAVLGLACPGTLRLLKVRRVNIFPQLVEQVTVAASTSKGGLHVRFAATFLAVRRAVVVPIPVDGLDRHVVVHRHHIHVEAALHAPRVRKKHVLRTFIDCNVSVGSPVVNSLMLWDCSTVQVKIVLAFSTRTSVEVGVDSLVQIGPVR